MDEAIKHNKLNEVGLAMEINLDDSISDIEKRVLLAVKCFKNYVSEARRYRKEKKIVLADIEGDNWPNRLLNDLYVLEYRYYSLKAQQGGLDIRDTLKNLERIRNILKQRQIDIHYVD